MQSLIERKLGFLLQVEILQKRENEQEQRRQNDAKLYALGRRM